MTNPFAVKPLVDSLARPGPSLGIIYGRAGHGRSMSIFSIAAAVSQYHPVVVCQDEFTGIHAGKLITAFGGNPDKFSLQPSPLPSSVTPAWLGKLQQARPRLVVVDYVGRFISDEARVAWLDAIVSGLQIPVIATLQRGRLGGPLADYPLLSRFDEAWEIDTMQLTHVRSKTGRLYRPVTVPVPPKTEAQHA